MVVVVAVGERREKGEEKECTGRSLYYSATLLLSRRTCVVRVCPCTQRRKGD